MSPTPPLAPPTRVIAVDDDRTVISALREVLLDEGYDLVGVAHDAPSGIALAIEVRPDVALVDMTMPGGGLSAIRGIRDTCAGACVIVLSAHDSIAYRDAAHSAGANRYLVKGVDDLVAELERCVAHRLKD